MSNAESEIKAAIIQYLLDYGQIAPNDTIVSEFYFKNSRNRADLLVCTDTLRAFEVKSANDSLDRLIDQCQAYRQFFEDTIVVVDKRHAEKAAKLLPMHIGLWIFDRARGQRNLIRKRKGHPKTHISKKHTLNMLRVSDLNSIMRRFGLKAETRRSRLLKKAQRLDSHVLRKELIGCIKEKYSHSSRAFWHHIDKNNVDQEGIHHLRTSLYDTLTDPSSGNHDIQTSPSSPRQPRPSCRMNNAASDRETFRYLQQQNGIYVLGNIPDDLRFIGNRDGSVSRTS